MFARLGTGLLKCLLGPGFTEMFARLGLGFTKKFARLGPGVTEMFGALIRILPTLQDL